MDLFKHLQGKNIKISEELLESAPHYRWITSEHESVFFLGGSRDVEYVYHVFISLGTPPPPPPPGLLLSSGVLAEPSVIPPLKHLHMCLRPPRPPSVCSCCCSVFFHVPEAPAGRRRRHECENKTIKLTWPGLKIKMFCDDWPEGEL